MSSLNKTTAYKKDGFNAVDAGNAFTISAVFFLLCTTILSFIIVALAGENNNLNAFNNDAITFLSFLCAPLATACTLVVLSLKTKRNCLLLLKPKKVGGLHVVSTVLIIIGTMFGFGEINNFFVEFLAKIGFELNPIKLPPYSILNVILSVVCIAIIPPLTEEILMRKIITTGLQEVGDVFAVIVGGVLFSLFHMSPQQTIYQFIVGASFSYIIVKGGDWHLTFFAHLFNNLFIVLNEYFFNISYGPTVQIILTVLGLVCYFVGVILLFKKGNKLSRTANKESGKKFLIYAVTGITACVVVWISSLVA